MAFLRLNQPGITNLTPHQGNRNWLISRKPGGGSAPVDPRLAFHALEGRQGVIIGEGALSASTGSTTIYAPDASGVYQPFMDEPVWEGEDWLKYQPAATNALLHSRNPGNSPWLTTGHTGAQDQVGIDGTANAAWSLTSQNGNTELYQVNIGGAPIGTSTPCTWRAWIKKTSGASTFPALEGQYDNPGPAQNSKAILNTDTGVATVIDFNGEAGVAEVVDAGEWWLLLIQKNTPPGLSQAPDFSIYPAHSTDGTTVDPDAVGTSIWDNCEVHIGKTIAQVRGLGPIFTTTAAASTAATVYNFDTANYAQDDSAWYWEIEGVHGANIVGQSARRELLAVWGSEEGVLLGANNSSGAMTRFWTGSEQLAVVANAFSADGSGPAVKQAVTYSGAQMAHNADGVYSTDVTHAPKAANTLRIGQNIAAFPFRIRNLRRYNAASLAEGKEIIDGLMA